MGKRRLYESSHPFDEHPFEVFSWGSWQMVDLFRIENGIMTLHLVDGRSITAEKRPFSSLRVKSRRATLTDCTCFLRPGIDVCVLSTPEKTTEDSNEEKKEPVWLDAKISSIERRPHATQCSCKLYIKFYIDQAPLGSENLKLSQEVKVVGLDQISVLQRIEKTPCETEHYRWIYSKDCSSLQRTKLCLGRFSSDLSWLLVASVLKRMSFHVRSLQNKIVYQILADDSSISGSILSAVNFRLDNGVSQSKVIEFSLVDIIEGKSGTSNVHETEHDKDVPFDDVMEVRRSKRRHVKPDRFLGCDKKLETENGWVRMMPIKPNKVPEDDMLTPISCLFTLPVGEQNQTQTERLNFLIDQERKDGLLDPEPKVKKKRGRKRKEKPIETERNESNKRNDLVVFNKPMEVHGPTDQNQNQNRNQNDQLAIIPLATENNGNVPLAVHEDDLYKNFLSNYSQELNEYSLKQCDTKAKSCRAVKPSKKKAQHLEDLEFECTMEGLQKKARERKAQARRYRYLFPEKDYDEHVTCRKNTLSAGAYNKLIYSYMKNIDNTMPKQEGHNIVDKWEEFKATNSSIQNEEGEQSVKEDDEGETSENEMLWREMELAMASAYFLDDNEVEMSDKASQKASRQCEHDLRLDEEVGIYCRLCHHVKTEIKHVSAPFFEYRNWSTENKRKNDEDTERNAGDEEYDLSGNPTTVKIPLSEDPENVWALIPGLRDKLHLHQKKAFEFLWRNVAVSLIPSEMEQKSGKIGGCVISHTPGAGKTFLIIAFLASYLKLFPGKRPLILAPKTTLYTWYKEFIKWEIPVPVHLIHGRRTYRVFRQKRARVRGVPQPSQDVMHVLDCLEKIQKWQTEPSVLVMGYTSFLTLMREDSKFAHRRHMAKVLRESPGLLILDEGHNPRSTKSRLRKVLMKVETDLRILLSGTLFQNNFCEYFNTLCLARPKFVNEVLKELDPKFKMTKNGIEKPRTLLENRARKLFLDKIARKIDANGGEERMQGLNELRNITTGFIDVYEGGSADNLPGLQIYTLMMNSTDVQHETLVKLHDIMATYNGYPLELELLITLASIHPWLIRTSNCVTKFFNEEELMKLDKLKFNSRKGSKVMFVLNLVYRVVKNEKILIFCHNIAPISLFTELFETIFGWQRGKEILVLTGDLELFERGRVMDKFEEPGGPSRVLLASITACAEGISLTAASRVIMMDSEWNPSKTKQAIARAFRPGQQKVVYVYQLLARDTLEEDKYRRTTWKEWVSSMIFSEAFVEDPSKWQKEKIEDDVLREIVEEDRVKSFHMIMKNEKASTG